MLAEPWSIPEPRLSDVLSDPIVQMLMRRDGIGADDIRRMALSVAAADSRPLALAGMHTKC